MDIASVYRDSLASAEAGRVYDDLSMMCPEFDPARRAELVAQDEANEKERAAHRAVCTCPYCDA